MNRKIAITILLVGALAIAAGFSVYSTVRAATPAAAKAVTSELAHGGFGRGFPGGYADEDLADALGVSVDELNTAYQQASEAALEQAVEAGLITQAQADELSARGFAFPFGGRWGGWLEANGIDFQTLLAEALGISVDRLQEAYTQAYEARIDRAVAEGRITEEQADLMRAQRSLFSSESFRSAMQSAFKAAVQQAVDSGLITQDQADQILSRGTGMGFPGFHGGHGFGGRGLWGGGFKQGPIAPEGTSTNDA